MRVIKGALVPLLLIITWELASRYGLAPIETYSRPSDILAAGWQIIADGSLLVSTYQTLEAAAVGLLIAILIGIPLGMLIGLSSLAHKTVSPTLDLLRTVPPVALIPLALLIFGFGVSMEAAVVAFASVWSIAIATTVAVTAIEKRLYEVALALEMSKRDYAMKIVLPAALARIAVGIRIAIGIALVVAVTVEIVVNPRGLGYGIIIAQQSLRPDLMYAQLLWIGVVGWTINALLNVVDTRLLARFNGRSR